MSIKSQEPPRGRRTRCGAANVRAALLCSFLLGPALALAQGRGEGQIRGTVYDADFLAPLPEVRVSIAEVPLSAVTKADGTFLIERVPTGSYTLTFSKEGYDRVVRPEVVVVPGDIADVRIEMTTEIVELDELIVTGADLLADSEIGLLEIRAEAMTVQDAISTEIIGKAGVGDVAGALKLVVGASVTEGKYATVRGLSDRYTGTTVNGVRIPSTDPRRRAVQLDLFPTGTIDGLTVTKTFTPDLQGDFTGGGVDIRTRAVPDGPLLSFSASVKYDELATNNPNFLTYVDGGVGAWGFRADDGVKALPAIANHNLTYFSNPTFFPSPQQMADAQALDQITRSFQPVMGTSREDRGVNHEFSLVGGNRYSVGRGTLGFIGALTYSHKYELYENGQNNAVRVSELGPVSIPREDNKSTDELLIGLLGSVDWSPRDGHVYGFTLISNEAAEDAARLQLGPIGNGVQQNQSLHYTERVVGSAQLRGSHQFGSSGPFGAGPWKLDWHVAANTTNQDEPDVRYFVNDHSFNAGAATYISQQPPSVPRADNTRRIFREIGEGSDQAAADFELPFRRWTDGQGRVKAGLFLQRGDRDFTQKSFSYYWNATPGSGAAANANNQKDRFSSPSPDDLWTDVFLNPDRIGLATNRCPLGMPSNACAPPNQLLWYIDDFTNDVNYTAEQRIDAVYAMAELPLLPALDLIAGVRRETTFLRVVPINLVTGEVEVVTKPGGGNYFIEPIPQEDAITEIDDVDWLPAVAAVWKPQPRMNVRLSFSRTVARPQFREMAPAATEEFLAGDQYVGNPDLILSDITNWDARWEWFRGPGEVLAASVFYKTLEDPIELISFNAAGRDLVQPVNYQTGSVRGAEIELRTDLGAYAGWARGLFAGVNATRLESEVDVPAEEQIALATFFLDQTTRELQGQPEYLLNAFLTYDNDRTGTSAGVFYNHTGDTLVSGAATGVDNATPNVFENAFGILDISASQKIDRLSVSVRARNLTEAARGSVYRDPRGEESIKVDRATARVFSVSVGMKW